MIIKFEVKYRDAAGRIGILKIRGKKVETPFIFPVVHPTKNIIDPEEINKKFKINVLMTNAYIIYKNKEIREKILKKGIHNFLGFNGIIETDSGSYQMLHYKRAIEVSNKEIIEFQINIGSDIINVLDIPTDLDVPYEQAKKELEITLKRIGEGIAMRKDQAINGAIQGGVYKDLRKLAALEVSKLDVDIYAIGTIVPYLIQYNYKDLLDLAMVSKILLPFNRPVHLFGVGHPLILPLAVSLGFDIFDSASYVLYAYDNRFMTPFGTEKLEKMKEFPCTCPVCSKYTLEEVKKMEKEKRTKLLAEHNLWMLIQELKAIKNAIKEGVLWELVILKAHAHPSIYFATKDILNKYYFWLKKLDPIRKSSGVLFQGELTNLRSDIKRAVERLKDRVNYKDLEHLYDYIWPLNQFEPKKILKHMGP